MKVPTIVWKRVLKCKGTLLGESRVRFVWLDLSDWVIQGRFSLDATALLLGLDLYLGSDTHWVFSLSVRSLVYMCGCSCGGQRWSSVGFAFYLFEIGCFQTYVYQARWPGTWTFSCLCFPFQCRRLGITDKLYHVLLLHGSWDLKLRSSCLCSKYFTY